MNFKQYNGFGTGSGQGSIRADYHDLVGCFGEPNSNGDNYKVQKEWVLIFEDGTFVTIYDWKEGDCYRGLGQGRHYSFVTNWSIGGESATAVKCVRAALSKYMNRIYYQPPLRNHD